VNGKKKLVQREKRAHVTFVRRRPLQAIGISLQSWLIWGKGVRKDRAGKGNMNLILFLRLNILGGPEKVGHHESGGSQTAKATPIT